MKVGDQVEIYGLRMFDHTGKAYEPYFGEIIDVRGIWFKRYTVSYWHPAMVRPKLCVLKRGQFSPLYDAPFTHDGFKYE